MFGKGKLAERIIAFCRQAVAIIAKNIYLGESKIALKSSPK